MFCSHDWTSRTGMDSGSYCTKCYRISDREVDRSSSGGLNDGQLLPTITQYKSKGWFQQFMDND